MSRKPGASVSVNNVQSDKDWTELCERQVEIRVIVPLQRSEIRVMVTLRKSEIRVIVALQNSEIRVIVTLLNQRSKSY